MTSLSEGTIFAVYPLAHPFSWFRHELIFRQEFDGFQIELSSQPNLKFFVSFKNRSGAFLKSMMSQPVDLSLPESDRATLMFSIAWKDENIELSVCGVGLAPDGPGVPRVKVSAWEPPEPPELLSVLRVDAVAACQQWIDKRRVRFDANHPKRPKVRPDRRPKDLSAQAQELRANVARLRDLTSQIRGGKLHFLGTLAGDLRSLMNWSNGKDSEPETTWDPLLQRLAAVGNLPLPVYAPGPLPALPVAGASFHAVLIPPSIAPKAGPLSLMDLQEWLQSDTVLIDPSQRNALSPRDLVFEAANTMGGGHYDDSSSIFVEALSSISRGHRTGLMEWMTATADVAADLGEWVLDQLKSQGLIE